MKVSYSTTQLIIKLTLVSLILPLNSTLFAYSAAVGVPTDQQSQQLNQQQQASDRSDSAGAAQAMAAMGAAMSGVGCAMGMRAAQQEPDPSKRAMLMSMAMQQCSQAAQNAASAAQNGEQKSKLDTPPAQSEPFKTPEMEVPKEDDNDKPDLSKLFAQEKRSDTEDKSPSKVEPFEQPKVEETKKSATAENKNQPIPNLKAATSVPNSMGNQTITANREEDEKGSSENNSGLRNMGTALAGRGSADDLLKQALAAASTQQNQSNSGSRGARGSSVRKEGADSEGGAGSQGSFGGSEGDGGKSPFDSFLAQMMGGGAGGSALGPSFGGGSDIVSLGKDKTGQPRLNIFQFASTVYSELSRSAYRVETRRNKPVSTVARVLGSEPNLVTKSSVR